MAPFESSTRILKLEEIWVKQQGSEPSNGEDLIRREKDAEDTSAYTGEGMYISEAAQKNTEVHKVDPLWDFHYRDSSPACDVPSRTPHRRTRP